MRGRPRTKWTAAVAAVAIEAGAADTVLAAGPAPPPEETRARDTPYAPAYPWQTWAPGPAVRSSFTVETVARGLAWPWSVKVLADGRMLVTEKGGQLRWVSPAGRVSPPIPGVPAINPEDAKVKGGLLDVLPAPDFAQSRRIYLSYSEPRGGGSATAVATGVLSADGGRLGEVKVIWRMVEVSVSHEHFGSRLAFDHHGRLFITTGERAPDGGQFGREAVLASRMQAQDLSKTAGKIIRINPDGSIPADNPFARRAGAKPEIWSLGHRNVLALAVDPANGELWTAEHGPKGGDELNLTLAGRNYGWPLISYGTEYHGDPVGKGLTAQPGMEQPVYFWDPNVAPGAMTFYAGALFPDWRGNLLIAGEKSQRLSRLVLKDHRVVTEEWLPIGARVRDVTVAPDGAVVLATDEQDGKILRLVPRGRPGGQEVGSAMKKRIRP